MAEIWRTHDCLGREVFPTPDVIAPIRVRHPISPEIVGVHVIPMMLGAVPEHPHWAVLTWAVMAGEHGTELVRERLPLFLDEVAEAFHKYWQPAPPVEELLARIARAAESRRSA